MCIRDSQHVLPHRFETATITSFSALCDAIRNMLVRGAGLIGATAGYGMWLAACEAPAQDTEAFDTFMSEAATALKRTRPTASNLAWAVDRQLAAMTRGSSPEEKRHIAKVTAQAIADEDAEACKRIGEHGKTLLEALAAKKANGAPVNILTPVSYTHLDVYKRQSTGIAALPSCYPRSRAYGTLCRGFPNRH